ncbi:MAG: hypothetical protein NZ700_00200 [Gemmataceae bacterium]|nr:hypothetical protein [Gemmataceae bacterium]MDW8265133.1 c-type cytochrome domain-containing protein [Gemmataceae bacterium]
MLRFRCGWFIVCGLVVLCSIVLKRPAQAAPPKGPISFINDVAPIFKENCFACHDAKKKKGKLDMTTYENLRKGGDNEDPIVPGKPDDSLLVLLLHAGDAKRMPPKEAGEPLPPEKIAVIEQWIKEGAKLDAGIDPKADLLRELRVRWQPPPPPAAYRYPAIINALVFTPDGNKLVVSGHHELTVWDIASAKLEKRLHTRAERAYALAFLPDGKLAVAGGRPGQEGDVKIYDLNGSAAKMVDGVAILDGVKDKAVLVKELFDTDDTILCLAISPDGKRLAAGGCDRMVRVWDLATGNLEQTIENHADWVFGVAWHPNGRYLVTCSRDKTAKVWDLEKKESVLTFPDHQSSVNGVVVRSDGKVGYSVGDDKNLRSFNVAGDGKQVKVLGNHSDAILKIALHRERSILVTAGADKAVKIWDLEKGALQKTLTGHTDQVFAVAISPDGDKLATGSYNGEVKVWKVSDGSVLASFNASPGLAPAADKK